MLSDAQKEQLSAEIIPLFQDLEQNVIQDIARRLKKEKRWTETAELQAKALEKFGYSPLETRNLVLKELHADKDFEAMLITNTLEHKKAVKREIDKAIIEAKKRGDDIVSRAGQMSFADDVSFWYSKGHNLKKSPTLRQMGEEASKRLEHEFKSLTHSTGFKFIGRPIKEERAFNYAMDKAIMNVASGTFSSQQAVEQVVSDLEKSGLRKVDFASGVSRGIDVAAHLAVRTTLGQMAADISMSNADELGTDLVEVTSHAGAREGEGHANHASWQGKVYSISGKPHPEESKRLGYKIEKLSDATGYPDDPLGLCGYNCRHTFYPFIEGISEPNPIVKDPEPVTVDERTYTYYQASQVQRRLERELRELKRQYIGGDTTKLAAIKATEQRYARFCDKAGLKQNLERLYVKGYKRDFEYIKPLDSFGKAELKVLSHGAKYGTEALVWLDKNGNEVLPFKTGKANCVGISAQEMQYLRSLKKNSIISLHNHPKSSSFSPDDMSIMCRLPSVETMRVVGHDGTKYALSVGDGMRPSKNVIVDAYYEFLNKTEHSYSELYSKDRSVAWKEHTHETVKNIAERFGWKYERTKRR